MKAMLESRGSLWADDLSYREISVANALVRRGLAVWGGDSYDGYYLVRDPKWRGGVRVKGKLPC